MFYISGKEVLSSHLIFNWQAARFLLSFQISWKLIQANTENIHQQSECEAVDVDKQSLSCLQEIETCTICKSLND